MSKLQSLEEMGHRMVCRGLPAKYVYRLIDELDDHLMDLSNENAEPNRRLGDSNRLENDVVRAFRSRSFFGRRPILGFLFTPIPLAIVVWVTYYATSFLLMRILCGPLDELPREQIATSTLLATVYYAGKIVPPAIAASLLGWIALRSGRPSRWLLSSICMLSLFCFFGLSSQIEFPSVNNSEGAFSLGIPPWPLNTQLVFSQLVQALVSFSIGLVFLGYIHKAMRSFSIRAANSSVRWVSLGLLFLAVSVGASLPIRSADAQTIQTEDLRWTDQFGNRRPWQPTPWNEAHASGDHCPNCDGGSCDCVDGRRSVFARLREVSGAWNSGDGDDLGITELDATLDFGTNLFNGNLLVSPSFGVNWLTGPTSTDLPSRLYDLRLDVTWAAEVNDRFRYKLQVSPGTYSDFRGDTQSVRMTGSAIGYFDWTDHLQLVFGATAFPEEDQGVTAVAGLVWVPRDDLIFELVFPAPRISWRFHHDARMENWLYFASNVTRVSYNVERTTSVDDIATYEASRLVVGVESRLQSGMNLFAEGGYAFDRDLEFDSRIGNMNLDDQAFVRMGLRY